MLHLQPSCWWSSVHPSENSPLGACIYWTGPENSPSFGVAPYPFHRKQWPRSEGSQRVVNRDSLQSSWQKFNLFHSKPCIEMYVSDAVDLLVIIFIDILLITAIFHSLSWDTWGNTVNCSAWKIMYWFRREKFYYEVTG